MKVVLDAGALIAIDRDDRRVAAMLLLARREGAVLVTSAPIVGQVWREGSKQSLLARTLAMIDVQPTDVDDAKRAGEVMKATRTTDVVDSLFALLVSHGDQVLTSDPGDIAELLDARSVRALVVKV